MAKWNKSSPTRVPPHLSLQGAIDPRRSSVIIHGSRGDSQQLLQHIMLLIYQRVCNVEPVEIRITTYVEYFTKPIFELINLTRF